MPAASGVVAHQAVARAEPDGHTLLFTNTSGMAVNLVSFKQLPYDPTRDFLPVAMVCSLGPQMLSVNAEVPAQTIQEFLSYARANRGKLSMGFDNTAGAAAFAAKLFNRRDILTLWRCLTGRTASSAGCGQRRHSNPNEVNRRRERLV